VYAHVQGFAQHDRARAWLDERLNGTARVGLPWPSLLAFLRLVTNPRVFERPESVSAAWRQVEAWLDCETVWVPAPTDRHRDVLGRLLGETGSRANLVPDAHLAALAIEHGLRLASTDGDFARFSELRFENPLAGREAP
jgi:toxin-antitoxin system PIN domain toxin